MMDFPEHVAEVRAHGERHREPEDVQGRRDHPGPTHPEEPAQDAHGHAEEDQHERVDSDPRNGEDDMEEVGHGSPLFPRRPLV